MSEFDLEALLGSILADLSDIASAHGGRGLGSIILDYEKTLTGLLQGTLSANFIRDTPRAYLEIYSDYEHPVLNRMIVAQEHVHLYIKRNQAGGHNA
ncbi:hypothetical protein CCL17_01845 [Pseudomonas congelans]|uniref:hypothetical protein n=1 Tax=Pseudomonas congelans TaxID=200452 RepID=UPI000BB66542|nr:hypothetical protein [Pseudomonas congelans]PBQ06440.1 hypothetical protein CCL17_01845 [Pseudomonas congelans]PBQ13963.1 hypothetical protein CCL08_22250 [Pseudomonas congelans]